MTDRPLGVRLAIEEGDAAAFADALAAFAGTLDSREQAILAAILEEASDPWARALQSPPENLSDADRAVLDALDAEAGKPR